MSKGFQFKQFYIEHSDCAMKVGTDSIMLGSWIGPGNAQKLLDIGTGCGLLGIMLAQKTDSSAQILGIDIDAKAISQAQTNKQNCPWSEQLTFKQVSLQKLEAGSKYDLIVSNPPYFSINQTSNRKVKSALAEHRIIARQTMELNYQTLLGRVASLLSDEGNFYCVLPSVQALEFKALAESLGLFCVSELNVQSTPKGKVIRCLLRLSRYKNVTNSEKIIIYNELSEYSDEYRHLCRDYYLNF